MSGSRSEVSREVLRSVSTSDRGGWSTILRLYNPLQPFFDKTWRPREIEPI